MEKDITQEEISFSGCSDSADSLLIYHSTLTQPFPYMKAGIYSFSGYVGTFL